MSAPGRLRLTQPYGGILAQGGPAHPPASRGSVCVHGNLGLAKALSAQTPAKQISSNPEKRTAETHMLGTGILGTVWRVACMLQDSSGFFWLQ